MIDRKRHPVDVELGFGEPPPGIDPFAIRQTDTGCDFAGLEIESFPKKNFGCQMPSRSLGIFPPGAFNQGARRDPKLANALLVPVLTAAFLQLVLTDLLAPFLDQTSHDAFLWTRTGVPELSTASREPLNQAGATIRLGRKTRQVYAGTGWAASKSRLGILGTPSLSQRRHLTKRRGSRPRNASGNALLGRPRTRKRDESRDTSRASSPSGGPLGEHGYRSTEVELFRNRLKRAAASPRGPVSAPRSSPWLLPSRSPAASGSRSASPVGPGIGGSAPSFGRPRACRSPCACPRP